MIFRLLYCSRTRIAAERMPEETAQILAVARSNNARLGIGGALLVSEGSFVQVLEGPLAAVETTFERIQRDLRHVDVSVLNAEDATEPHFAAWDMAFLEPSNVEADPRLIALVRGRDGAGLLSAMRDIVIRQDSAALSWV